MAVRPDRSPRIAASRQTEKHRRCPCRGHASATIKPTTGHAQYPPRSMPLLSRCTGPQREMRRPRSLCPAIGRCPLVRGAEASASPAASGLAAGALSTSPAAGSVTTWYVERIDGVRIAVQVSDQTQSLRQGDHRSRVAFAAPSGVIPVTHTSLPSGASLSRSRTASETLGLVAAIGPELLGEKPELLAHCCCCGPSTARSVRTSTFNGE